MDTKKKKKWLEHTGTVLTYIIFRIRSDRSIISACMGGKYSFQTRKWGLQIHRIQYRRCRH